MKATMDMTTGQWEIDLAPDVRFASDDLPFPREVHKNPVSHARLCELTPMQPLYAGMPVGLATEDVDRFISRMDGSSA